MQDNLLDVWNAAASAPFSPAIAKSSHALVASILLIIGKPGELLAVGTYTDTPLNFVVQLSVSQASSQ